MARYHYIPSTPKDAYMGKYGGLEKRHTITIAFSDETRYHEYIDNKIELSSLSETNTQQGHQNGYQDYPLKCFTTHVCMNMIAERTRNVKSLVIFVRLSFLCQETQ